MKNEFQSIKAVQSPKNDSVPYDPKTVEDKIYAIWEKSGFFNPDKLPKSKNLKPKTFTIIMPPINANGSLHAGHGLVLTIEDIMIRYKRMRGYKTLWLPGTDHAGFETQIVYEKKLEKEGRSRFNMNPKELYKEIMDFTLNNKKNIEEQIKKMGSSCDWSREKFTLEENVIKTVYDTFKKLYDNKLIYRGRRIINWCPKHQTSLSDLETMDTEQTDKLYYLKYGPFVIATARPETKFGDKYVVMHPDDKRYKEYKHEQILNIDWINGKVTAVVIKDKAIDMSFGTGVMTITPWHDSTDFEIAERHNLDKEQIIDFTGRLLPIAGEFSGIKILEARPQIIEKFKSKGLLVKTDENYKHIVKTCYKCNTLIEPQIKNQWFMKMKPLAAPAIKAIKTNKIKFLPAHYKKIILHWLKNIYDWNISRQIVWGIPIPAKICEKCENGFADIKNKILKCPKCGGAVKKETDTFDTWFSSGQWPYACLNYPNSKDCKTFYPTQVMETAGEIIFFWVARMIMFGLYTTGKIPFENVYLHGLVLDARGKKMSKSKGNVINPLDLTAKYGTDAFRIGMVVGNTPGTSLALDENRIKGYRNFANKVWNAARFTLISQNENFQFPNSELSDNLPQGDNFQTNHKQNLVFVKTATGKPKLTKKDKQTLSDLNKLVKETTKLMDNFKFYLAAEKIYHYFWHTFADKIIEESKPRLQSDDKNDCESAKFILLENLTTLLKLLHPFMPFITEEIWSRMPIKNKKLLIIEEWPN